MLKTALFKALDAADLVTCDGVEVQNTVDNGDIRHLSYNRNEFVWDFRDQEVEIEFDGKCEAHPPMGAVVNMQFQMLKPLTAEDLEN